MARRLVSVAVVVLLAAALVVAVLLRRTAGDGGSGALAPLPALTGAASTADAAAATARAPVPVRHVTVQGTLAELPGAADAWKLADQVDEARVVQLAKAFGLSAAPVADPAGGWSVSSPDRWLSVARGPGAPWTVGFGSPPTACGVAIPPCAPNGDCPVGGCEVASGSASTSGGTASGGAVAAGGSSSASSGNGSSAAGGNASSPLPGGNASSPDVPPARTPVTPPTTSAGSTGRSPSLCPLPPCPAGGKCPVIACAPIGPPPTTVPVDEHGRAPAVDVALSLVRSLGFAVDAAHAQSVPEPAGGWAVTVEPLVAGVATQGWSQQVAVDASGAVVSGHGSLALPTKEGAYPLVGVKAGLDRLGRGEFAFAGGDEGVFGSGVAVGAPPATAVARPVPAGGFPPTTPTVTPAPPATSAVRPATPAVVTTVPVPGSTPPARPICAGPGSAPTVPAVPCTKPDPSPCAAPAGVAGTLPCPMPPPLPPCNGSGAPTTTACVGGFPLPPCNGSGAPTTTACVQATVPVAPPDLVVTGARLGLTFAPSSAGTAWLEPVYVFTTKDEGDLSVPAVVDALVATPPDPGRPVPTPRPLVTGGAASVTIGPPPTS
jgi:hypothetical protein